VRPAHNSVAHGAANAKEIAALKLTAVTIQFPTTSAPTYGQFCIANNQKRLPEYTAKGYLTVLSLHFILLCNWCNWRNRISRGYTLRDQETNACQSHNGAAQVCQKRLMG
jgi:hypothetical protein